MSNGTQRCLSLRFNPRALTPASRAQHRAPRGRGDVALRAEELPRAEARRAVRPSPAVGAHLTSRKYVGKVLTRKAFQGEFGQSRKRTTRSNHYLDTEHDLQRDPKQRAADALAVHAQAVPHALVRAGLYRELLLAGGADPAVLTPAPRRASSKKCLLQYDPIVSRPSFPSFTLSWPRTLFVGSVPPAFHYVRMDWVPRMLVALALRGGVRLHEAAEAVARAVPGAGGLVAGLAAPPGSALAHARRTGAVLAAVGDLQHRRSSQGRGQNVPNPLENGKEHIPRNHDVH